MMTPGKSPLGSAALVLFVAMATVCQSGSGLGLNALPLYYGFFPDGNGTELGLKQLARETLMEALGIDEVRRLYCQYTNHSLDTPVSNLSSFAYTNPTDELHVTSFYCNHGQVPDCARYAASPAVRAAEGRGFALNVTALLLTPRTLGFRAELGPGALAVWANGEGEWAPGQRAHFTAATSPGVSAVQTGLDLLAVANRVGRPIGDRVLDFQRAQFLVLLHRPVPVVFRPSDDGGGAGATLRPSSWLALLAASSWQLLRQRLSVLMAG